MSLVPLLVPRLFQRTPNATFSFSANVSQIHALNRLSPIEIPYLLRIGRLLISPSLQRLLIWSSASFPLTHPAIRSFWKADKTPSRAKLLLYSQAKLCIHPTRLIRIRYQTDWCNILAVQSASEAGELARDTPFAA